MDDTKTPADITDKANPTISPEEAERRRTHVRVAIAENRIEGIETSPATQEIFEAYVRGEIDARDLVTVYQKGPHPR